MQSLSLFIQKYLPILAISLLSHTHLYGDSSLEASSTLDSPATSSIPSNPIEGSSSLASAPTTKVDTNSQPQVETKSFSRPICRKFSEHVDFIYWKADEDGLEYGTKMTANPIIGASSSTHTKLLDMNFKWDPGFSIGTGYTFNHFDCWSLNLDWTHIHNHAHRTSSAQGIESQTGSVDTIISPWVNLLFALRAGASKASAHWHLHYDTVDLDFGKNLDLSKRFTLAPYFGLRGAWLDQHYHVKYKSEFLVGEGRPIPPRNVTFKGKNDFSAFGLRGGTELMCHLSKNWHIFSQFSGNILFGRFTVKMKNLNDQGLGEGDIPPMPLDFTAKEHLWRARLSFQEAIGLGYAAFFGHDKYRLRLRASYELSQWISQNQLFYSFYFRGQDTISAVPIRNQGNLSFHGIRVAFQFDF
jgi:hypothetical protein